MLGAVVALRRGEHMRMTAIVGMVSPPVRAFLDVLAIAAALVFLILIVYPAYEFAHDEMVITTPALQITNAWRAAALPVGSALMLLIAVMRLLETGSWRLILGRSRDRSRYWHPAGTSARTLRTDNENLLIFFVGIVALNVFAGVPIAFAFGLATYGYLAITYLDPDDRDRRTPRRGHVASDPALRSVVRLSRPVDRDDRYGAGDGHIPRQPAGARPWRPALCAGGFDVPGVGHLRIQGRGHGSCGACPVPGDAAARSEEGRPGCVALCDWCTD
jgi:hypothetical protein